VSRPKVAAVAQAFKEAFTAAEVAAVYETAIRAAGGEPCVVVGSDGGDGFLDALAPVITRWTTLDASDPLSRPLRGVRVGWLDATRSVVESRLVCGLGLLQPPERAPLVTSTRGVGQLIVDVVAAGARTVFVGLGGSATVDGGLGMARAWGWVPRDAAGRELPEGGGALAGLAVLDPGRRPPAELVGVSDVGNPLLGSRGARVFAAQKGASRADTERLAAGLERLAAVTGQDGALGRAGCPGAGAAGGLGFGLLQFADGRLEPGSSWVLDRVGFDAALDGAALLLVGEGAFDRTSLEGKLPGVALSRAAERGVGAVLVSPAADYVPEGVAAETGGGWWDIEELAQRVEQVVRRALRLLGP
jgi:glycerate kinase